MSDSTHLRELSELGELQQLVEASGPVYVRFSEGPDVDAGESSMDSESGLELPGLSVNPLTPEPWWSRPLGDWLARQICQYKHLADDDDEGKRFAWVLTGEVSGRGPDCEPLIADIEPIARLSNAVLAEAEQLYQKNFEAGKGPTD